MSNETASLQTIIPLNDIERMAAAIAASGLFGLKTKEQALALMLIAQAEGRHPALAARDYDIIQGRPSKKSEAMYRDFLASGGTVQWTERTDTKASAIFTHPSQKSPLTVDWDLERAKKAGLNGKDMYTKYARQMLSARVISEGVRATYPAATSGFYTPEEVREFEPSVQVNLPVKFAPIENDPGEKCMTHEEVTELSDRAALIGQLKIAIAKVAAVRNVTDDEATVALFEDQTGKMTFDKIGQLTTAKQIEKAKQVLVKTTSILIGRM